MDGEAPNTEKGSSKGLAERRCGRRIHLPYVKAFINYRKYNHPVSRLLGNEAKIADAGFGLPIRSSDLTQAIVPRGGMEVTFPPVKLGWDGVSGAIRAEDNIGNDNEPEPQTPGGQP